MRAGGLGRAGRSVCTFSRYSCSIGHSSRACTRCRIRAASGPRSGAERAALPRLAESACHAAAAARATVGHARLPGSAGGWRQQVDDLEDNDLVPAGGYCRTECSHCEHSQHPCRGYSVYLSSTADRIAVYGSHCRANATVAALRLRTSVGTRARPPASACNPMDWRTTAPPSEAQRAKPRRSVAMGAQPGVGGSTRPSRRGPRARAAPRRGTQSCGPAQPSVP
jgi:hypothetical protein